MLVFHGDISDICFLNGNKLIYAFLGQNDDDRIVLYDENFTKKGTINPKTVSGNGKNNIISYDGYYMYSIDNSTLYEINIDYGSGKITTLKSRQLKSLLTPNNEYGNTSLVKWRVNSDVSLLYLCEKVYAYDLSSESSYSYNRTKVYSVDFTTENVFELIQTYDLFEPVYFNNDKNGIWDGANNISNMLYPVKNFSKVIGLKYMGEYYYKTDSMNLTALPENVEAGKKFIGRNGSPEVGTLNFTNISESEEENTE